MELPGFTEIVLPPSANAMHTKVRGRVFPSREYIGWLKLVGPHLEESIDKPAEYPVAIDVLILGGRGFRMGSDLDNVLKPIGDVLHAKEIQGKVYGSGILVDDNTDHVQEWRARFVPALDHYLLTHPGVAKITKKAVSEIEAKCFIRVRPIAGQEHTIKALIDTEDRIEIGGLFAGVAA